MNKQEKLLNIEQYKLYAINILSVLDSLKKALIDYDKKIIDKRFFEKYFSIKKDEYRDWTKYSLSKPRYSFDKHAYEIYLGKEDKLELAARSKTCILDAIEEKIKYIDNNVARYEKEKEEVTSIDEELLKKDILAVYEKHNKPSIWQSVLDDYSIKYPKE